MFLPLHFQKNFNTCYSNHTEAQTLNLFNKEPAIGQFESSAVLDVGPFTDSSISSSRTSASSTSLNEKRDDRRSSTASKTTSNRLKLPTITLPLDTSKKLYPTEVDPQLAGDEFFIDSKLIMTELKESWGVSIDDFNIAPDTADADTPLSRSRLENVPEAIIMSESWNKVYWVSDLCSQNL